MPRKKKKAVRRAASDPVDAKEKQRRARISASLKQSDKQKAHHERLRGVKRGPESLAVRAKKAASKRARPGTPAWELYYKQALRRLRQAERDAEDAATLFDK